MTCISPQLMVARSLFAMIGLAVLANAVAAQSSARVAQGGLRRLARGVVIEVPAKIEEDETFSGPRELIELLRLGGDRLDWSPHTMAKSETLLAMAKDVTFRRSIWALEFGFKPLRIMTIDVPNPDGTVTLRKVHYLVYYVKNNGRHLNPEPQPDSQGNVTYGTEPVNHTIRFFPKMVLKAHDVDRAYLDEVIPAAVRQIRRREDPNRTFYDSVSISSVTIPVSSDGEDNSVWGVATWTGVDPRSDFMSVFVQGLTNAYRWQDPPGAYRAGQAPMTGRRFSFKTLQLNFWRAGDAIDTREEEIRFGVPNQNQVPSQGSVDELLTIYRLKERVDYLWVYR